MWVFRVAGAPRRHTLTLAAGKRRPKRHTIIAPDQTRPQTSVTAASQPAHVTTQTPPRGAASKLKKPPPDK
jgi:hypothetical protein